MDTSIDLKDQTEINPTKVAIWERTAAFERAMAAGNAQAVADCYCIDAQFMNPNAPSVVGRENIEATMAGYIQQGFTNYQVTSLTIYGSTGVIGVQSTYKLGKPDGSDTDMGKSIQLWKTENGYWKIYRDCFNSDLPASS